MKNKQALALLFTANAISGLAQGLSMLAIPWYFTKNQLSGEFTFYYAVTTFAGMFWSLYAGTLIDRFRRKDVFLASNLIEGLLLLGVAVAGFVLPVLPWQLIVLVFVSTSFGYTIHYPNLYAFAQEITEPKDYQRVMSYIEIVGQSTSIASGCLSTLLLDGYQLDIPLWDGVQWQLQLPKLEIYEIFLIDSLTYFIAFGLITFIRYDAHKKIAVEKGALLKRLRSGFNYLHNHRSIAAFGFLSYTVFIAVLLMIFAMMPVYVKQHLQQGGHTYAMGDMMYSLGALSAGVGIRLLFRRQSKQRAILVLMLTAAFMLLGIALSRNLPVFFVATAMIGFCNAGIRIQRISFLMEKVPGELIGRVDSVFGVAVKIFRTALLGLFALPFFAQASNITYSYLIMGVFIFIATLLMVWLLNSPKSDLS